MRDFDHPAFRQCHFGTSGIGKTTHFLETLKGQLKLGGRTTIIIYDHKHGEFAKKLARKPVKSVAALAKALLAGGYVLFDPTEMFGTKKAEGFEWLCKFIYAVAGDLKGRKVIVADELQMLTDTENEPTALIECMDDARSLKVDVMLIAQGGNTIHNRLKNQFTEIFAFRQADDNGIKFLKGLGFDESTIKNLRPGEWLWKNLNTGLMATGGKAFEISNAGMPLGGKILKSDFSQEELVAPVAEPKKENE